MTERLLALQCLVCGARFRYTTERVQGALDDEGEPKNQFNVIATCRCPVEEAAPHDRGLHAVPPRPMVGKS
jgi:hypothetical protein